MTYFSGINSDTPAAVPTYGLKLGGSTSVGDDVCWVAGVGDGGASTIAGVGVGSVLAVGAGFWLTTETAASGFSSGCSNWVVAVSVEVTDTRIYRPESSSTSSRSRAS